MIFYFSLNKIKMDYSGISTRRRYRTLRPSSYLDTKICCSYKDKLNNCIADCYSKVMCGQDNNTLCKSHCQSRKHDHCNIKHCENTKNICEITKNCKGHCKKPGHSHCISDECESTQILCDISSKCFAHCAEPGHFKHCSILYCAKTDVCQETSLCILHCKDKMHGHCMSPKCDRELNRKYICKH